MSKILVIGDGIIDEYVWGIIKRQSPEDSSIPVVDFVEREYKLGGALNVASNIKSLSKKQNEIFVSSVFSDFTSKILKDKGIFYDEPVLKTKIDNKPHERELIKTRIINSENARHLLRIDNREAFSESDLLRYKNKCSYYNFIGFDAIVVSDYNKGLIDSTIMEKLESLTCPIFVDTKKNDLSIWKNIKDCYVKINSKEFNNSKNHKELKNLIVTEGEMGCSVYKFGMPIASYKAIKQDEADVVGAGDCFIAGLVVATMEGKALEESLKFATKVATISVTKFGTSEVFRSEVK